MKNKYSGLGVKEFFCMGFGAIVGCGWALSINKWMLNSGGPLPAMLGYLACLIIMIPIGLCYSELSPMFPVAGGSMVFAYHTFGEKIAYIAGWATVGGYIIIIPWEAIYVVDVLSNIFPFLTAGDPLYMIAGSPVYLSHILIGIGFSLIFFLINMVGIKTSAIVQNILCFVLLGCGILVMIISLFTFDFSNFKPFYKATAGSTHSTFTGGVLSVVSSAAFFLSGFETIPQSVEESKKSKDNKNIIGKTVIFSIVCACLFYAMLLFTLGGAMPWQDFVNIDSPAAANLFLKQQNGWLGKTMYLLVLIGAVCGMLTTWNGFMIATSRIMMGMSRGRLLPPVLAKTHPKYKTPVYSLIVCFVVSCIGPFLGIGLIDPLTTLSSIGLVASWMIACWAFVRLRKKEPDMKRPYRVPLGMVIGIFATVVTTLTFIGLFLPFMPMYSGDLSIYMFIGWALIGVIIWILTIKSRNSVSKEERRDALFAKMNESDE